MPNKFREYEIVRVMSREGRPLAAVRETDDPLPTGGKVYNLLTFDGQQMQVPEDDLESTGTFETPFQFYEVVVIHPVDLDTEPEVVHLTGKRGIITGIAPADTGKLWGFSVAVQNGEGWYFTENELRSTGILLSHDILYRHPEKSFIAGVSPDTDSGEGTVVSGNASLMIRKPTPLSIDLETL